MRNSFGMTRKVVAGASAFALIAANMVVLPSASAAFSDVSMDNWAYDYIMDLVDMKIVEGNPDGTFRPDNSVNRAEMAKIVSNLAKKSGVISSDDTAGAPSFKDVPAGEWFTSYVSVAAKNKLFEGYRDTQGNLTGFFGPGNAVNRAEASKVLLLAAGVPEMLTPGAPFVDVKSNDWFYPYVTSAYNWSIIDGYKNAAGDQTGSFGPGDAMTRGQIAKVAVLAQDPIDRYTGIPLNEMENGNTNEETNVNTNTGTGSNLNQNTGTPVSNVSFEAKLSPSSPAATQVASGTAYNTVATFDLTAGKDEDVNVTELTVLSRGFIADSSINGVVVVDEFGRHGNIVNFSNSRATINFANNPIVVKAGSTKQVSIQLNFTPGVVASGTVGVELPTDSIKAVGAKSNGLVKISAQGPLAGAIHTLVSGANVGRIEIDNVIITSGGAQLVDLGLTKKEISKFKITEALSNEDVSLTEITFFNNGNTSDTDLENLKLVDQDGLILAEVKNTSNRNVTFDLSAKPYVIKKGTSKNLSILADIVNGSTRTVQFVLSNDYDVKVKGETSKAYLLPTAGTNDNSFPVGDATGNNIIEVKEGTLTVSKANASPSGEVSRGSSEVVLADFSVEAAGEDIEIQGGTVGIIGNVANLKGTLRLVNGSGTTIHSVNANGLTPAVDPTFSTTRFNNYYTVKAGTVGSIKVVVDVADGATAGQTLSATLKDLNIKKISSTRNGVAATTVVNAGTLTITAAQLSVAQNASANLSNIVLGSTNQKIGSMNIRATNSDAVNVSSIVLNLVTNHGVVLPANQVLGLTNMKLMLGDKQIGSTIQTPGTSNMTFGVSGELNIPRSETRTIDIYANVASTSTLSTLSVQSPANMISGTAGNNSITAPAGNVNLQTVSIVPQGTLIVATTNTVSNSRVLVAGETAVRLVSFKAEANNNEDMRLERLFVELSQPASIASVSLTKGGVVVSGPQTLIDGKAEFADLKQVIAKDTAENYVVVANLASGSSFNSGAALEATVTGYEVYGVSSGNRFLSGVLAHVGPTMTLHNAVPKFAVKELPLNMPLQAGADVVRFSVQATGSEAVVLRQLEFTRSGSAAGAVNAYELYRVSDGIATLVAGGTGGGANPIFDLKAAFVNANPNLSGYEIPRGETVEFVVRANTSLAKGASTEAVTYALSLTGVAGGAGNVDYSYKTANTPAGIAETSVLNDYSISFPSRDVK